MQIYGTYMKIYKCSTTKKCINHVCKTGGCVCGCVCSRSSKSQGCIDYPKLKGQAGKRNKRASRQTKSRRKMRAGLSVVRVWHWEHQGGHQRAEEDGQVSQRKGLVVVWNNRKTDRDRTAGQGVTERKRLGNTGKREGKQRSKGRVADNRTHWNMAHLRTFKHWKWHSKNLSDCSVESLIIFSFVKSSSS